MKRSINTLFLDVGGVLLTNGWDHKARQLATATFGLDAKDFESRHNMTFDTYEIGKISLRVYLERVIFYEPRSFTIEQFQDFMFKQSQPLQQMLDLIPIVKKQYGLKVVVVSNEGRELTEYRIKKFQLAEFVDFFICSCFVHFRKPDLDIYRIALDAAQVKPEQVLYIDDRLMFIQVAESIGIKGIHHTSYESTKEIIFR